jgi:hypothetical protein
MAFSDEVLKEAWEKAGGQCECNRRTHRHFYTPCGRLLKWEKRNDVTEGGWEAREIDSFAGNNASNCIVLCMECYQAIH